MTAKALVAGCLGMSGQAMMEHLATLEDWSAVGVSRRRPEGAPPYTHLALDLTDPAACRTALAGQDDITHLFYAARSPRPDPAEEDTVNARMLENLLDAVEAAAPGLRHVCLVHGTKWYGCQVTGFYETPAHEDDPGHLPPNFYLTQQRAIARRQTGKGWTWSALRPHHICGASLGYGYNLLAMIAVYAVVSRELGLPLRFPGTEACYRSLSQATDARILAKAMIWAATTPACANEAFNIVNGDLYRYCHLWPKIADFFDMEVGPVQPIRLARVMADKAPLWDEIVAKHGLRPTPFADIGSWVSADTRLAYDQDDISALHKCQSRGFFEVMDSEDMFLDIFARLRAERIIP